MFSETKIHPELTEKGTAINCGGIELVNNLMNEFEFLNLINNNIKIFKVHNPYFESDHIFNIMNNLIFGGECIEDIELLRNSIPYLNGIGAQGKHETLHACCVMPFRKN